VSLVWPVGPNPSSPALPRFAPRTTWPQRAAPFPHGFTVLRFTACDFSGKRNSLAPPDPVRLRSLGLSLESLPPRAGQSQAGCQGRS
jgi:hypothetical protein